MSRVENKRFGLRGLFVLGYLSVGTLEPYRSWYRKLRHFRLSDRFEEFDEDYARGLLTLSSDYTRAADIDAIEESVTEACGAGAIPFVSNIWLTRIPDPPLRCE